MLTRSRFVLVGTVLGVACLGATGGASAAGSGAPMANRLVTPISTISGTAWPAQRVPMSVAASKKGTKMVELAPFKSSGRLKKGWRSRLASDPATISCRYDQGSVSAVNGGTHDCGTTADGASACWVSPAYGTSILCLNSAWSKTLTRHPASHIPAVTHAPKNPRPLALKLSDGSEWVLRTGGAWGGRADGLIGVYGCRDASSCGPDRSLAVLTEPGTAAVDTSRPVWTVLVGELGNPNTSYPAPQRLAVKKAWFIRSTILAS